MNQTTMRTWAEINLDHLEHNYRALRGMIPRGCRFLGVVKANAYGHGAIPVARKLEELGAEYLAVACLEEGTEIRSAGIEVPVLVLGPTPCEFVCELVKYGLTQTVSDYEYGQALSKELAWKNCELKIHIKADTGMSRLGFPCDEARFHDSVAQIRDICQMPGLKAEGIFTHFANADADENYSMLQLTRFLDLTNRLEQEGIQFEIRHCAASAAVLNYPCAHMDMVRPGISLYGHYPHPSCVDLDGPGLIPVMTLKTRIASIRDLPSGTNISYGCTHRLDRDSKVAVLPVGYADGLNRLLSNCGEVLIQGRRAPILGRVCMDMCMVDVTDIPDVNVADEVIIFGAELPLEEKADAAGTIQYELLCAVSPRVQRVYIG